MGMEKEMVGCDQFLLEGIIALVGVGFKVCSTEAFGTHAPYSRIVQIEGNEVLSVLLCVFLNQNFYSLNPVSAVGKK